MVYFIPFIAVLIGAITALFIQKPATNSLKLVLAFSGAFLLSSVAHEFLPDIYTAGDHHIGIFLILGVFIQIILEFFSHGAEHGHLQVHKTTHQFPYVLFISLCLHALIEGMPLQHNDGMVYAIAVHKLPIAFIFASFLIHSKVSKVKAVSILLVFSLMTPLGSLLADQLDVLKEFMIPIKAIVAGIILHVSTTLILESSEAHKFNLAKILVMILAVVIGFSI